MSYYFLSSGFHYCSVSNDRLVSHEKMNESKRDISHITNTEIETSFATTKTVDFTIDLFIALINE